MTDVKFPNESAEYRSAREKLLQAEIELRAMHEEIATMRRALPAGGIIPTDYVFERFDNSGRVEKVKLSALFENDINSLLVYSFMYSPEMEHACPMCSSMLDGLDGNARHIQQRMNLAVVAKSPVTRIAEYSRSRGWHSLPLLSAENNSYQTDYFGEGEAGNQQPMANVFVRDGDTIRHFWGSELLYADVEGQPRHVDALWPLWNALDLGPTGRGEDWYPAQ